MTVVPNGGGWAEYQRLVLAELERHSDLFEQILATQYKNDTRIALLEDKIASIDNTQKKILGDQQHIRDDIFKLRQGDAIHAALRGYRNWIIGILVTILVAGVIPLIRIFVGL